jgi:hypothetical protein
MLVWASESGFLHGVEVFKPLETIPGAPLHLRKTMKAARPTSIRVASKELAAALSSAFGDLKVMCAPTPEIDGLVESFSEFTHEKLGPAPMSYFDCGVDPSAVASFFRAAARLYEIAPWSVVPSDSDVIEVTIPELGLRDGVLSVMGQMGESFGIILFASIDDFDRFASSSMEESEKPNLPRHMSLCFESRKEMPKEMLREIKKHRWEVAGPHAVPLVMVVDEDLVSRQPTPNELARVEAIALGLVGLLRHGPYGDDEHIARVVTSAGEVEVSLSMSRLGGDDAITDEYGEIDERRAEAHKHALMVEFEASPEARTLDHDVHWSELVTDYAASHLGTTPSRLEPAELSEIVFEIIPRKVICAPSSAGEIVAELQAFFCFLDRGGAPNAKRCLRVLENSTGRLERELSNPANFGIGKSLIREGAEAGFDVHTEKGLQAWFQHVQGRVVPAAVQLPSRGAQHSDAEKKRKRKAERKARRQNR